MLPSEAPLRHGIPHIPRPRNEIAGQPSFSSISCFSQFLLIASIIPCVRDIPTPDAFAAAGAEEAERFRPYPVPDSPVTVKHGDATSRGHSRFIAAQSHGRKQLRSAAVDGLDLDHGRGLDRFGKLCRHPLKHPLVDGTAGLVVHRTVHLVCLPLTGQP